jgi:hypothetical protein
MEIYMKNKAFVFLVFFFLSGINNYVISDTLEYGEKLFKEGKYSESCVLFEVLAEKGNIVAQSNLGGCYGYGLGRKADPEKALYWYRKAAESGRADMIGRLGGYYFTIGSHKKAVPLIKEAVEKGDEGAKSGLAMIKWMGYGGEPVNKVEAYRLFYDRAQAGDENSQQALDILCKQSPWACK